MTHNTVVPQNVSDVFDLVILLGIVKFKFHNGANLQSLVSLAACLGTLTDNVEMCHGIHHKTNHHTLYRRKKTPIHAW